MEKVVDRTRQVTERLIAKLDKHDSAELIESLQYMLELHESSNAKNDVIREQQRELLQWRWAAKQCGAADGNGLVLMWQAQQEIIGALKNDLSAYRNAGVTEELLRRHDGFIKVGKGCVLVREEDYVSMKDELERRR